MVTIIQEIALPETLKPDALQTAVACTLEHEGMNPDTGISIVITDDPRMQELNAKYRSIEQPTDVLAFPIKSDALLPDELIDSEIANYLGDVVISLERAQDQIQTRDHDLRSELLLLVVHGILHLCGHDHIEQESEKIMWAAQREILTKLGVKINSSN